ncbi:MAG: hypothetical protein P8N47_06135 [Bacteroidia bacterium]|jgi:hypothetical protein|nr:hypothetical protein [Bacteroidia bacterium]
MNNTTLNNLVTKSNNKQTINAIIDFIGNSPALFAALMDHIVNGTSRVSQTTSWALGYIGKQHAELIAPYHSTLVLQLQDKTKIAAVRRNVVRIYQTCPIPQEIEGELYEACMSYILDSKEAIAIKAFSMTVCERIATRYPDLIPELAEAIQRIMPTGSNGIKNRGKHTMKRLTKKISR